MQFFNGRLDYLTPSYTALMSGRSVHHWHREYIHFVIHSNGLVLQLRSMELLSFEVYVFVSMDMLSNDSMDMLST